MEAGPVVDEANRRLYVVLYDSAGQLVCTPVYVGRADVSSADHGEVELIREHNLQPEHADG